MHRVFAFDHPDSAPLAVKAVSVALASVIFVLLALPVLALGAAVVA
jgi:hypothetical protein